MQQLIFDSALTVVGEELHALSSPLKRDTRALQAEPLVNGCERVFAPQARRLKRPDPLLPHGTLGIDRTVSPPLAPKTLDVADDLAKGFVPQLAALDVDPLRGGVREPRVDELLNRSL